MTIKVHPSIKNALGYDAADSDESVLDDWKLRKSRVCKPCWELKYCPYGPLVEQSPTVPPLLDGMVNSIEYFKKCLETNTVGNLTELSAEDRTRYEEWLTDDQILLGQARYELSHRQQLEDASKHASDEEMIDAWIGGKLPPIHIYRASFEHEDEEIIEGDFSKQDWAEIQKSVATLREKYTSALKTGFIDNRQPLEPARAAWFQSKVNNFDPGNYPNEIPQTFSEAECNIFGHICPVFFAAESFSETATDRRRGRYIPFAVKMRVVRRDNYTCQHCTKHLRDDEVEFDHIIPVSKGGSSEEHNIRLTCFDCNRDKSDDYVP